MEKSQAAKKDEWYIVGWRRRESSSTSRVCDLFKAHLSYIMHHTEGRCCGQTTFQIVSIHLFVEPISNVTTFFVHRSISTVFFSHLRDPRNIAAAQPIHQGIEFASITHEQTAVCLNSTHEYLKRELCIPN